MTDSATTGTRINSALAGGSVRQPPPPENETSIGDLVKSATADLSGLLRMEIELAKTELKGEVRKAAVGAVAFVIAGLIALLGVIIGSGAIAELFALALPRWAGYLVVAVLYFLLAGLAALVGISRVKKVNPPRKTIETVKDDLEWVKHPTVAPDRRDPVALPRS